MSFPSVGFELKTPRPIKLRLLDLFRIGPGPSSSHTVGPMRAAMRFRERCLAEAIIRDKKRILPCAAFCQEEYGVGGYFVGVPAMLGAGGVEKVIEVELDAAERKQLDSSVEHVKELVAVAEENLRKQ